MQKGFSLLMLSFVLFGMLVAPAIIADDRNPSSNSGDNSVRNAVISANINKSSDNETETGDNKPGMSEDVREKNRTEIEKEFGKTISLGNGGTVMITRKIEVSNGEVSITIIKKVVYANGTSRMITITIEKSKDCLVKENANGSVETTEDCQKTLVVKDFNATTNLELNDNFDNNETDLEATLSNGSTTKIKIMPDTASEIALERLRAKNFTVELREVKHKNVPRVVYNVETNKHGKFLGIFKLAMKVDGQVDPETGQFIGISKPWWAFLVTGEDSNQTGEDNGTGNETNQTNQTNETDILGASCGTVTPGTNDECCQNKGFDYWNSTLQECGTNSSA